MKTIWKWSIDRVVETIPMPRGADVVHVGHDPAGILCIWAEVDSDAPLEDRVFEVFGTGHDLPAESATHLSTWVDGDLVLHLYEVTP